MEQTNYAPLKGTSIARIVDRTRRTFTINRSPISRRERGYLVTAILPPEDHQKFMIVNDFLKLLLSSDDVPKSPSSGRERGKR